MKWRVLLLFCIIRESNNSGKWVSMIRWYFLRNLSKQVNHMNTWEGCVRQTGLEARTYLPCLRNKRKVSVAAACSGGRRWGQADLRNKIRNLVPGTSSLRYLVIIQVEILKGSWIFGSRAETPGLEILRVNYIGGIYSQIKWDNQDTERKEFRIWTQRFKWLAVRGRGGTGKGYWDRLAYKARGKSE